MRTKPPLALPSKKARVHRRRSVAEAFLTKVRRHGFASLGWAGNIEYRVRTSMTCRCSPAKFRSDRLTSYDHHAVSDPQGSQAAAQPRYLVRIRQRSRAFDRRFRSTSSR